MNRLRERVRRSWQRLVVPFSLACAVALCAQDENALKSTTADDIHVVSTAMRLLDSEGCARREPIWSTRLAGGKRVLLPLFLFEKNHYFIVIGSSEKEAMKKLQVGLFDIVGRPLAVNVVSGEGKSIIHYSAVNSGRYYLSLMLAAGSGPVDVAVGYVYK